VQNCTDVRTLCPPGRQIAFPEAHGSSSSMCRIARSGCRRVISITHDEALVKPGTIDSDQMAIAKDFVFFGRLCLDFAHTGDMGHASRFERLTSPGELQRWLSLSPVPLPKVRITARDLHRAR